MNVTKKKLTILSLIFVSAAGCATVSTAQKMHTNSDGMTLYTFDKDGEGVSNCYEACAAKWPPHLVSGAGDVNEGWTQIERKDGSLQWAVKGAPLYTWIGDSSAGDTNGDGIGGVWHIAGQKAKKAVGDYASGY